MPFGKNLRKCFINTLFSSGDINIINLLPIIIECYDNNETHNFLRIFISLQNINIESIKKSDIESKKEEIINKFTDTNFINEIELLYPKDFDFFICKLNLFLSIIYLKFDEVDKFYSLLIDDLEIEQLFLFLNIIQKINLFFIFTFEIIDNIFQKFINNNKEIKNIIFEICFKLLKHNKDKLDLIFVKINEFKGYLNNDLINNINSNKFDNKEISIDIEQIINFNNLKKEEIEIFFNYIQNNYFQKPSNKNITRYIFYINLISIFNSIIDIIDNYEYLKKIDNNIKDINYDNENKKELQKKIKEKIIKHINFNISNTQYSSKDYFLNIEKFLSNSNKEIIFEVINKNIHIFSEKLAVLSFNDFKLFNEDLKKFIINLNNDEVLIFFSSNINRINNLSVLKEIFEIFFKFHESERKDLIFKILQLFTLKINNLLKFHDSNTKFTDDNILFLIQSIIDYYSIYNDDSGEKKNISNMYKSINSDTIFLLILFSSEKNRKKLLLHLLEILKEKINFEENKINNIKKYINDIIKNKEINQLNQNQIELIKNIIEIASLSPLNNNDFFLQSFTAKEGFFLYLKNIKIIHLEQFKQIKFIKESIEYSNKIKELFQNKQLKINQLLKFKDCDDIIFESKFSLIYDNNDEMKNISNNIKEIEKIFLQISECEKIQQNLFFKCNSFKYDSILSNIKTLLQNSNIEIFQLNEFKEQYDKILNFLNKDMKSYKQIKSSLVFMNIFNDKIKNEKKDFLTYEENIKLFKNSYCCYVYLIDFKHVNGMFDIDKIELYFKNVDIKNEIYLLSKTVDQELNQNEINKICEKINFIIDKTTNYKNIEKFIYFLSLFTISNSDLKETLNELKNEFEHSFFSENLNLIQNKFSNTYLTNGNEFNDFIKDLISITNLFHELSIIFKQMFEKKFENDEKFISEIKNNLFENLENKKKIKYALILSQDFLIFEILGKIINDKRKGDKVKMDSFLKKSNFTIELNNNINEGNNELYSINNIKDNYIKDNNELIELWENSILFLSNKEENNKNRVLIMEDELTIYNNFNLIIKKIKNEINLFIKSIQKGCFYIDKIYNQINNGELKIKKNKNEEYKDYDNYIEELKQKIEEMELETIRLYEDDNYYNLTFFYGQQYLFLENIIYNQNNNKDIETYLRYLTNGYKIDKMRVNIENNDNRNKLQKINYFINELFKLNNLNYNIIFKDYFLSENIKFFEPGIYYQKYKKNCEIFLSIYTM